MSKKCLNHGTMNILKFVFNGNQTPRDHNSTFPPCILSRELKYGVNLPSVMSQSRGKIFIET